ncbi:MAG: DUF3298 domain-containing protein [Chitinophagales bacterium]
MIRNISYGILLSGCLLSLDSCKPNKSGNAATFDVIGADTLVYDFVSIDTTDASCVNRYKYCPNATISYPVFNTPDTALNRLLNAEVMKAVLSKSDTSSYASVEDYLKNFFHEYSDLKKQGDYDDESSAWHVGTAVSVYDKIGQYLTLKIFSDMYEGGAHPNSYLQYKVVDLISGRQLNASQLMNLNDSTLLSIGERCFRKDNGLADTTSLEDASYFIFGDGEDFEEGPDYGKFRFNNNFALTKEGVEFWYNAYEIGPYAVGASSFVIPYKDIQAFLKVKVW